MISFNRIPSHMESATWKKLTKKSPTTLEEGQDPDFEDIFQAVAKNSEVSAPADRKPSQYSRKLLRKNHKLDLSI